MVMQLGIFARTFMRPTVEEVFAAVAKHHLRCVQFNFACAGLPSLPDRIEPELLGRIRKAAAEHRIDIAAVSGTFNMIHPDPKQRRDGLRKLGVVAGACRHLGTSTVTLCTGTRDPEDMWRHHPDNDSPEAWRDLLVSITKALTLADKHEMTLGIEPETGNVVSSARHARRLLDEMKSPRLKIIMDAANLFHPGELADMKEILDDAFDLLGPDLVLAHAKDLRASGQAGSLTLGKGVLDWDHYLGLLQAANWAGPLILHGFDERQAAASVKFLRSRLPSAKSG
jgi:sugar phosphate isomerase/epimerase